MRTLIFSGATLPFEVMPTAMQKVVSIFPMARGIELMKTTFLGLPIQDMCVSIMVMVAVMVVSTGIAVKFFKWE